jgi:hypothetical protein
MAAPLRARGAKSKANLKKGGPGRPKLTAEEREGRKLAKKLVSDPAYLKNLQERLRDGKAQPGVEVALWHYAHGKPPDVIENKTPSPVRIVNVYSNEDIPK